MQPTTTWREERRRDRLADAQISRETAAARAQASLAASETLARLEREDRQARRAERRAARKQRAARWGALTAWFRGHVTDLLFVPVIAVPGALAWTAMAAYGSTLYGSVGVALPAFSEGSMWAFAAATTITRRRSAADGIERPLWHLRLGTVVFAAEGGALNFAHGVALGSLVTGVVMALVSVAGVIAHQLITAGPRRTRAGRAAARDGRAAGRRQRVVRRAASRHAVAEVDPDGAVRLLYRPGTFALARRFGRPRLEAAANPSPRVWLPWPMVLRGAAGPGAAEVLDTLAAEAVAAYRGWRSATIPVPADGTPAVAAREPWPGPAPALQPAERAVERAAVLALGRATAEARKEPSTGTAKEPRKEPSREPSKATAKEPPAGRSPAKPARVAHVDKSQEAERARGAYRKSVRDGSPLTDRTLGEKFGKSRTWGANRIRETEAGPHLAARTGS